MILFVLPALIKISWTRVFDSRPHGWTPSKWPESFPPPQHQQPHALATSVARFRAHRGLWSYSCSSSAVGLGASEFWRQCQLHKHTSTLQCAPWSLLAVAWLPHPFVTQSVFSQWLSLPNRGKGHSDYRAMDFHWVNHVIYKLHPWRPGCNFWIHDAGREVHGRSRASLWVANPSRVQVHTIHLKAGGYP